MKKTLKTTLLATLLSLCLVFPFSFQVICQTPPTIEVLFSPEQGEEILQKITSTISNAEKRVYVLIYSFTLDEIAQALIQKHSEGVDVKVIMDQGQAAGRWAVTEKLEEAGIPLAIVGKGRGYMHIKALIADDVVLTGSYNYSANATYYNDENLFIIRDNEVLEAHLTKFNQLWQECYPEATFKIEEEQERAPPLEEKININTASKEELTTLPGIGEVLAEKIIECRDTHGYFESIEEIMKVVGIGEATFERIENKIEAK